VKKTPEELNNMANLLFELQLLLEPIKDKAMDEKARMTGYVQCAETMIKIIANKIEELKKLSIEPAAPLKKSKK
jgi:hypothetical protein